MDGGGKQRSMEDNESVYAAHTIEMRSKSKNLFFLIHGYTGSPTDFNGLVKYLHKRFKANVKVMRMVGHGTSIDELDELDYSDFLKCVEKELVKDLKEGKHIIIGGLSLGSLLAFDLAARYPVKGVMSSSAAYTYKFPLNFFRFAEPFIFKKHFRKSYTTYETVSRTGSYNYPHVHIRAIKVIAQAKKRLRRLWGQVVVPCVLVHCEWDRFFDSKSNEHIVEQISSAKVRSVVFSSKKGSRNRNSEHNLFYSPFHAQVYRVFGDFVEKNRLFGA